MTAAERKAKRRQKARDEGRCTVCLARPKMTDRTRCEVCVRKQKEAYWKNPTKRPR